MKTQLNEIRRMQQLAGLLKEGYGEYDDPELPDYPEPGDPVIDKWYDEIINIVKAETPKWVQEHNEYVEMGTAEPLEKTAEEIIEEAIEAINSAGDLYDELYQKYFNDAEEAAYHLIETIAGV